MSPDSVANIVQTPSGGTEVSPKPTSDITKESANTDNITKKADTVVVDTVSISEESLQKMADIKQEKTIAEEAKRAEAKKEEVAHAREMEKSEGAIAKVQFVYDLKGELSIRYLDTAKRLIYQVPSKLMQFLKEAASKADSSVDTRV